MSNEETLFVLLSVGSCISLVLVLAICVCGCRKQIPNGIAPTHRSLPDIPKSSDALVLGIETNVAGDTGSELYATVGDKVQTCPKGSPNTPDQHPSALERSSLSQHSSLSQGDDISSTYATVKSPHAYDQVRRNEHSYARLQSSTTAAYDSIDDTIGSHQEHPTSILDPSILTRSRRPSSQSLNNSNGQMGTTPTTIDISAAPAIAGRVSANQELPYMTPPLISAPQHFSGDSQDSSKGYTSISVREPLAILAQNTQGVSNIRRTERPDPHYATVSDDSDEMYAAIEDPNPQTDLYTSGSETYAQIQPPVMPVDILTPNVQTLASVHIEASNSVAGIPLQPRLSQISNSDSDAPHPLSVNNLRHLAQVHSRQASSSSCNSSVTNLGSPKPEKRQANSPLPPPPPSFLDPNKTKFHNLLETNKYTNTTAVTRNSTSDLYDIARLVSASDKHRRNYSSMSHNELQGFKKYSTDSSQIDKSKALQDIDIPRGIQYANDEIAYNRDAAEISKHTSPAKTLEEMYAKVVKKHKNLSNFNEDKPLIENKYENAGHMGSGKKDYVCKNFTKPTDLSNDSIYGSDPEIALDVNLEIYNKNIKLNVPYQGVDNVYFDTNKIVDPNYETIKKRTDKDPGYETIGKNVNTVKSIDPGYETLKDRSKNSIDPQLTENPKYSQHSETKPGISELSTDSLLGESAYESLPNALINDPGYEAIHNRFSRPSGSDCDPNYEVLRPSGSSKNHCSHGADVTNTEYSSFSDTESPGYSSIKESIHNCYSSISELKATMNASLIQAGYSVVNKKQKTASACEEPNYESMPTIYTTGSESDPNYESVKYLDIDSDPPYERLHNDSPGTLGESSILDAFQYPDMSSNLNHNTESSGYETVNNKKPLAQSSTNTDSTENVEDYFHV